MKVKGAGTERRKEIIERKEKKERKERGRGRVLRVVVWEEENGEKKKERGDEREGVGHVSHLGGWEKMMLSSPNQSGGDMWQGGLTFYLNA